ncbi:MAG: ubiquinone/menaquinone biosynthesis C-methylase UbiE [Flavobacteriales bacterium]|jgi:ubiquinone/menaquinone biosynthesis C-methylase UbiE
MNFLGDVKTKDGVYILSEQSPVLEANYLAVREKEGRVLTDYFVSSLPHTPKDYSHSKEWKLRQASTKTVMGHLHKTKYKLALDLGCGNGWFTHKLTQVAEQVIGMDMNKYELTQANRVFGNECLNFCYADVFSPKIPSNQFDLITINAAVQYFLSPENLIHRLLDLLTPKGEIHILDSPFYSQEEVASARERTKEYFASLGSSEMARYYFHHTWQTLHSFNHKVLYDPNKLENKAKRKLGISVSPFPWIVIGK